MGPSVHTFGTQRKCACDILTEIKLSFDKISVLFNLANLFTLKGMKFVHSLITFKLYMHILDKLKMYK